MTNPSPEASAEPDAAEAVPSPPVRRVMDILLPKLRVAFQRASTVNGDQPILWDAYMMGSPNPMQPGSIASGLMLYISIPGSIVNQVLGMTAAIAPGFAEQSQEIISSWVLDRLNDMISARHQQTMDEMTARTAEQNGHREPPAPPSGLIVPGR